MSVTPDGPIPAALVRWGRFLRHRLDWLAGALIVALAGLGAYLALARHAALHTFVYDLGYTTQVIWNTSQGRFFQNTLKTPQATSLADHFAPAMSILSPAMWIAPDARVLILTYVIVIALAVVPAYLVMRKRYPLLALVLVAAFAINPLIHQQSLEEFHDITMAVPMLTLAAYALYKDNLRLLLIALALTLVVREDMGIYVASFGLFMFVRQPKRRWLGVGLMIVGAAWVGGILTLMKPVSSYIYVPKTTSNTSALDSIGKLVRTTLKRINTSFNTPGRPTDLVSLVVGLAALPLLAAGEQLLWLPMMAFLIAISGAYSGDLFGYHIAPMVPLLWYAAASFLARLPVRWASTCTALLLAGSLIGFRMWSPFPGGGRYNASDFQVTDHDRIAEAVMATIPAGVPVAAQDGLGAHLTTRQQFYLYPWYDPANPPQMIMLDANSTLIYPIKYPEQYRARLNALEMDPTMQLAWEQDGVYLFRYDPAAPVAHPGPWEWSPWLRLDGYDLAQTDAAGAFDPAGAVRPGAGGGLRVSLYWTSQAAMTADYTVSVQLITPDGFVVAQNDSWPGNGTLATHTWQPGQSIRDIHYLDLPSGRGPEDLRLNVIIYELGTLKRLSPEAGYTLTTFKP